MEPSERIGPKDSEEVKIAIFDFDSDLPLGDSLVSCEVEATVWAGEDSNPQGIREGASALGDRTAQQRLTGGVRGVTYKLRAKATGTPSLTVHVLEGLLEIR